MTVDEVKETGKAVTTAKKAESRKKDSPEKVTVIYCGPSIKGVVQQYAHFNNGIPKRLQEYAETHKSVERLIVPIENLVETKKNIIVKGTVENVSYLAIQKGE